MPAYTIPGPGTATGYTLADSGGSSGPNISDLDWLTVDLTDGTWTASDPSGVLGTSVSVASDVHTFDVNDVAVANASYNFSNSTNGFNGPRWYKALEAADGTRITADDTFTMFAELVVEAPTNKQAIQLGWGFCQDPTATASLNTIAKTGIVLGYDSNVANARTAGMTVVGRTASTAVADQRLAVSTVTTMGLYMGAVSFISLDSAGLRKTNGTLNNSQPLTTGTDLFLVVLVGLNANTTTITAPADIKGKLRYRLIKHQNPPT